MKYQQISIPNDNAQFLESQKFSVIQIARLLNIPPHMLKDLDRATFSNIEHQGIEFVTYTMMPWFTRWQQTNYRKLLLPGQKGTIYTEFMVNALLRGDSAARAEYYTKRFYLGSLSPNDIREMENENPIDDPAGDKYFVQRNMIPIDMADDPEIIKSSNVQSSVRQIATREKQNILKALKREQGTFDEWLEDFYRDFSDYIKRQIEPLVGIEESISFTEKYVSNSRELLRDKSNLEKWEELKEVQYA
jgi:hypothetical protein